MANDDSNSGRSVKRLLAAMGLISIAVGAPACIGNPAPTPQDSGSAEADAGPTGDAGDTTSDAGG